MTKTRNLQGVPAALAALGAAVIASSAEADFLVTDDLIVKGDSACVGSGCVNNEFFGSNTLKLKEDNLRIRFDDTSRFTGYPSNDWQITVNDAFRGALSKFSIDDITHRQTPFTVEAGAPSHSLYVDNEGRVGIGTSVPIGNLEITNRFNPALIRLRHDRVGMPPELWGIEAGGGAFLLRNPNLDEVLVIFAGAPTWSFIIGPDGNVGFGTGSLGQKLNVAGGAEFSDAVPNLYITNTDGAPNNRTARIRKFEFENGTRFSIDAVSDDFAGVDTAYAFVRPDGSNVSEHQFFTSGTQNFTIDAFGNVAVGGATIAGAGAGTLQLFEGTAPSASATNSVVLFAEREAGTTELRVLDGAGNDTTLSPHNFAGHTPDPDDPFPWSYHSRNAFLGQEIWVDMSGAIRALEKLTGQTFIHRRTFAKSDWTKAKQAAADAVREREVLRKMREEEVEVPHRDAIEAVAVTETVEGEETETVYRFDPQTGAVEATERPVMVERPTGERRMRIKPGIRFDERTGKFYRHKTRAEAEAEVPAAVAQKMPGWIAARVGAR